MYNSIQSSTENESEANISKSFVLNGWPDHKNDLPVEIRP